MSGRKGMGSRGRIIGCLVLALFAGAGCSDRDGVPSGILSRDKMESLVWDMEQAQQYAEIYLTKDSAHINKKTETLRLYNEVFRLHQVSREEFRRSYRYYLEHPKLNQLLFDSVIARGIRARSEDYDRPFSGHPPGAPAAAVTPATGVVKPGAGTARAPGPFTPAFVRSRDSVLRVGAAKKDTIRKHS